MKDFPAVRWLLRVLLNPGWAPLTVVALHLALAEFGLTQRFDHLLHLLGGASMGYFLDGLILRFPFRNGRIPDWGRYLLSFTSACTVAVFWEFAEFASDRFFGTTIQQGLEETILDLSFGVLGAAVIMTVIVLFRCLAPAAPPKKQGK